jgi:hypothetical protein
VSAVLPERRRRQRGMQRACDARVTFILRQAYRSAHIVMNPCAFGADLTLAWPAAAVRGDEVVEPTETRERLVAALGGHA